MCLSPAGLPSFLGGSRGDKIDSVTFEMHTEVQITLITQSNYTGADAISSRSLIDTNFGNNNGIVEQSEVTKYKNSILEGAKGLTTTQNTYMDTEKLRIENTTVEVINAEGAINSTNYLQLRFVSGLKAVKLDPKALWHTIVFIGSNYGNNTITLIAPAGWKIANNPKNFQVYNRIDDDRQIFGRVIKNYDAEIKMYNPEKMDQIQNGGGDGQTVNLSTENIMILIPILLAVIVVILLFGRKKAVLKNSKKVNNSKSPDIIDLKEEIHPETQIKDEETNSKK